MNEITFHDKNLIKQFFNCGGYVLDFSNSSFDAFTTSSVGIPIQKYYNDSKGRSLEAFINEVDDNLILKLTTDLLQYYEDLPESSFQKNDERNEQAVKLKNRLNVYKNPSLKYFQDTTKKLKSYFDDDYIENQIMIMKNMIEPSPSDAIGKAKELLESCFKHILDAKGTSYQSSETISALQKKVFKALNIDAKENVSAKNNDDVKRVLSGLNQIVQGINNLRNDKGNGHGKGRGYAELPSRYASLVVSSSITIVTFVWETYHESKKKDN